MPQWVVKCICGKTLIAKRQSLKYGYKLCDCIKPKCTYDLSGGYGVGYTNKGEEFWFDLEDYNKIKDFYWWYDDNGYVQAIVGEKHIRLHRLVMNITDESVIIDHIQHPAREKHKIDNRKSNLRIVTASQNCMNSSKRLNNTSGITGVYWSKNRQSWVAEIGINNKGICLGYFANKDDAIKARQQAENKYFKEFSFNKNNYTEE